MADLDRKGDFDVKLVDGSDDSSVKATVYDSTSPTTQGTDNPLAIYKVGGVGKNPVPATDVMYKDTRLLDGSNKSMNVDGSSTAVDFQFAPGAGEVWYVEAITFFIVDPGTADYSDFGSITGSLTNGLQLNIKSKGTVYQQTNLQDNADIVQCFGQGSGILGQGDGGLGFLNEDDLYFGTMRFMNPIKLDGDQGDYVEFKVRDNLTALTDLQTSVHVWRTI